MRRSIFPLVAACFALSSNAFAQGASSKWYLVPGVHYGMPTQASFSLAAFRDGRNETVGKGWLVVAKGGRDAGQLHLGMANVEHLIGYGAQIGAMRTFDKVRTAAPNSTYAGIETHLYIGVVNLGVGLHLPVGTPRKRKGVLGFSAGLGF